MNSGMAESGDVRTSQPPGMIETRSLSVGSRTVRFRSLSSGDSVKTQKEIIHSLNNAIEELKKAEKEGKKNVVAFWAGVVMGLLGSFSSPGERRQAGAPDEDFAYQAIARVEDFILFKHEFLEDDEER